MHDSLISYINGKLSTKLTEEESNLLVRVFKPKKIRRRQYVLQEGEVCSFAGFIVKGAFRQYTVDKTGKENVLGLYIENWWVADRESFMFGTPSPYFIDASEDSEMLMVSREDFVDTLRHQPFISEMTRVLTERQAMNLLKRVQAAQTLTAEERYEDFRSRFPEFLQRFPQHIIASYLGMTKETLSRIRAASAKR